MIYEFQGMTPKIDPSAWIAPNAVVLGNVEIGPGASVWFGAVIRGDNPDQVIRIGGGTSVQDNCVVHVSDQGPTLVGEGVTIGHGAVIESCEIGDGALIGMNAVVLQQAKVGAGALIAAGAVVSGGATIPPRHLAVGMPAIVKREMDEGSSGWIREGAEHYVDLARSYRRESWASGGE